MRHFLASFILLCCFSELRSQTFNIIEITARQHDEPPSKEGRPAHQLTFKLEGDELALSSYNIANSPVSTNTFTVSRILIDSLSELLNNPRTNFILRREVAGEQLQPIEIDIDSMKYCKSFSQTRTLSTGGTSLTIRVKNGTKELWEFELDSSEPDNFDFQKYLTVYPVLQNNLPDNLPGANFFDDVYLMMKVSEYLETINCEDFYYREFVNEHPERTPQQNRTRTGWNFKEYLKSRSGS